MSKKINIILIFILSFLVLSCGYKKISQVESQIHFQNVNVTGDKRIGFMLKNDLLLISNKDSEDKYVLDLNVTKKRKVKQKNSAGKVTRYNLSISANLLFKNIDTQKTIERSFVRNSDYDIAKNHSDTINNEKNTKGNVVQKLSEDISNFIILYSKY